MMTGPEIRTRRKVAKIAGALLCQKANINRSKLSDIELGYVQATDEELTRLTAALETLISAREKLAAAAKKLGWPTPL